MRATQRLRTLKTDPRSTNLIANRVAVLLREAQSADESAQPEQARIAATALLRFGNDTPAANAAQKILQKAYAALPSYRLPHFQLSTLGRTELRMQADPSGDRAAASHQMLADELLFLGLYDEGIPELLAARIAPNGPVDKTATVTTKQFSAAAGSVSDTDYTIAVYSLRGGQANRAVRFAEQVWRSVPADFVLELAPRDLVELLYPAPYRDAVLKHTAQRNIDARFVLAIARQESRFQADAKSVAAARGMMQFISATARDVAAKLNRAAFQQDDLYNPDAAILFGAEYLSSLFKQFPNQPQAVAAAYNGGPDNVARWIARARADDPDRYVPEIGFSQTKDYVYRVMSNFWNYERLYDAQLQRKQVQSK